MYSSQEWMVSHYLFCLGYFFSPEDFSLGFPLSILWILLFCSVTRQGTPCLFLSLSVLCWAWFDNSFLESTGYFCRWCSLLCWCCWQFPNIFWLGIYCVCLGSYFRCSLICNMVCILLMSVVVSMSRWWHSMEMFCTLLALCEKKSTGHQWIPLTESQ